MKKKGISLNELKSDKENLIANILQLKRQLIRFDGILGYLSDNITKLEEKPKDEKGE